MKAPCDNPFLDPNIWTQLQRRDDDIVIATYAKFGLLRMQVIIDQLLKGAEAGGQGGRNLPWVELRHPRAAERIAALEAQSPRRILRTHLTAQNTYAQTGKYIFVGRDPRDLIWNLYHLHKNADEDWRAHFMQYGLPKDPLKMEFREYWENWMLSDGAPFWSYFDQLQSWWLKKDTQNVMFIHFLDFKFEMESELSRIAKFLEINIPEEALPKVIKACNYQSISQLCNLENALDSPFWNGGLIHSTKPAWAAPLKTWETHLNLFHEHELRGKLECSIGKKGAKWIFSGSS